MSASFFAAVDRSSCRSRRAAALMLCEALFDVGRRPDVKAPVRALQDVNEARHDALRLALSTQPLAGLRYGSLRAPFDSTPTMPRGVARALASLAWLAMSEAPEGPSRMVEAPGVALVQQRFRNRREVALFGSNC